MVLVGAVLAVGAYVGWYRWSGSEVRTVDAVPALPPRLESTLREPEPEPALSSVPSPPQAAAAPVSSRPAGGPGAPGPATPPGAATATSPAPAGEVQVRVRAATWMFARERPGGTRAAQPRAAARRELDRSRPGVVLTVGNAPAVDLLVDGQPVPGLGPGPVRREVVLDPDRLRAGPLPVEPQAPRGIPARPASRPAQPASPPQ